MNKNYKNKKQITITVLSVVAVCLVVGLIWYIGTMGRKEPPVVVLDTPKPESPVTVLEIDTGGIVESKQEDAAELRQETEAELEQETQLATKTEVDTKAEKEREQPPVEESSSEKAPVEIKPITPKDSIPPSEPPADSEYTTEVENPDSEGNCQPEHTQPQEKLPQGGDTNAEGGVYVPGFGYIESSGPNEQGISHTDGDWNKQMGTMQ